MAIRGLENLIYEKVDVLAWKRELVVQSMYLSLWFSKWLLDKSGDQELCMAAGYAAERTWFAAVGL